MPVPVNFIISVEAEIVIAGVKVTDPVLASTIFIPVVPHENVPAMAMEPAPAFKI